MNLKDARAISEDLVRMLEPFCERVEIAGGVRRRKAEPHDIEIVCEPKLHEHSDLWGNKFTNSSLDAYPFNTWGQVIKNGPRFKQIQMPRITCDLFIVLPPAQWGVILTIRTGPADFSHWIVTQQRYGGALPNFSRVSDGAVYQNCTARWQGEKIFLDGGELLPMPEERDFLDYLGLGWVAPNLRTARWNRA